MLSDSQVGLLVNYVDRLLGWNKKVNLISRQDEELVWQNHILHSISPLFKLTLEPTARIMDLGTGGGLPGIPLKILLPETEFLLVDSTRKKIAVVEDIIKDLGLRGISTVWGRVEELAKEKNLLSHFDYIVARAVAPLNELVSWSTPFFRPWSSARVRAIGNSRVVLAPALIALKGGDLEQEIRQAERGNRISSIEIVDLVFPGSEEISSTGKKIVVVSF